MGGVQAGGHRHHSDMSATTQQGRLAVQAAGSRHTKRACARGAAPQCSVDVAVASEAIALVIRDQVSLRELPGIMAAMHRLQVAIACTGHAQHITLEHASRGTAENGLTLSVTVTMGSAAREHMGILACFNAAPDEQDASTPLRLPARAYTVPWLLLDVLGMQLGGAARAYEDAAFPPHDYLRHMQVRLSLPTAQLWLYVRSLT